jgi:hypothetical protein
MNRKALTIILVFSALVLFESAIAQAYQPGEEGTICLGCHENKNLILSLKNRERLSLYVDGRLLAGSAHQNLQCSNCHTAFSVSNHPERRFKGRRNFTVSSSEVCKQYHVFNKGIHFKMLNTLKDIVCADCRRVV